MSALRTVRQIFQGPKSDWSVMILTFALVLLVGIGGASICSIRLGQQDIDGATRVLGNVRQWQPMFYGSRYSQTDPHRKTDYVKLADAFGARGFRVSNIAELRDALREAVKRTGPVLIDAQIDKDERVLPMIPAGGTVDDLVTE